MTTHAREIFEDRRTSSSQRRSTPAADSFRHEALLYGDLATFLDATMAFITEGLAQDAATLVFVNEAKINALCAALGDQAQDVTFADMALVGANPARIIPAWSDFVATHSGSDRPLRGIGEPIWAGRDPAELAECHIHESLLNLAFAESPAFWLLCPYDTRALDPAVLHGAHRNHTVVRERGDQRRSEHFSPSAADLFAAPLPPAPIGAAGLQFDRHRLAEVRQLVGEAARAAGLGRSRASDLLIAVNELATNSVIHGDGAGTIIVWCEGGSILCEVRDRGRLDRPLAGRVRPSVAQPNGRGLWLVNQLCDLVQLRTLADGTVVRVHQHLPAAG
ncbi:MAG TPA: sensor histidine kinase [Acidimicrobiales bacterium]|nr:sensor histidine kinase [Acidimicrobiales bacterium]